MSNINENYGFETLSVKLTPDPITGATQVPIYQSIAFSFKSADHGANLFALKEFGFIYSRLNNPTVSALNDRINALEGGVGAVSTASGMSAQLLIFFNLLQSGDNFLSAKKIYGGTVNQFGKSFKKFGWEVRWFDHNDLAEAESLIDEKTKAIFIESLTNPEGLILDIEKYAALAHKYNIPLIVDNTLATPFLLQPFKFGADIIIHATTKFISGNGSTSGGIVIDSGNFDWKKSGKFQHFVEPNDSYNNISFYDTFGKLAFTVWSIAVGLRDLGIPQCPFGAFLTLSGCETLALRVKKHSENAKIVAEWLRKHPKVKRLSYIGFDAKYNDLISKYLPNGIGSIFTIEIDAGLEQCKNIVNNVKLFLHLTNIGDSRTIITHPASTTHAQLSEKQKQEAGLKDNVFRLSIGIEDPKDIVNEFDRLFKLI